VGKDAGRGKLTYPGLLGVDASRRRADELCAEAVAAADWLTRRLADEGRPAAGEPLADLARWVVRRDR
jgi:geranylgeranyl diphosphate synthase type II